MIVMRCSRCGNFGIYWKGLNGPWRWTFCPTCNMTVDPVLEQEDEDAHKEQGDEDRHEGEEGT